MKVTSEPQTYPGAHEAAEAVRMEYVVAVTGKVRRRPEEVRNIRMATGGVEVRPEILYTFSPFLYIFFDISIQKELASAVLLPDCTSSTLNSREPHFLSLVYPFRKLLVSGGG